MFPSRGQARVARLILLGAAAVHAAAAAPVETLESVAALPPHIAGTFREPLRFQQAASGEYFVLDRLGHVVYAVDAARTNVRQVVQVGFERGRILQPSAFDLAPDGSFVIADAPHGVERVQAFLPSGAQIGGFTLPGRHAPRIVLRNQVLSGVGSIEYTGRSVLVSQPDSGTLVTEYDLSGTRLRSFGELRPTGHEGDPDVHVALNTVIPLADPSGGWYVVFRAGMPVFRKYDDGGALLFERRIEGIQLDEFVRGLPNRWPREQSLPVIEPTVTAAAVDRDSNLWLSLAVPYTYVYDRDGDKRRILQLRAAGILRPTALSFAPNGRLLVTPGCYEFEAR
jgi:hypothetical protein